MFYYNIMSPSNYRRRVSKAEQMKSERYYKSLGRSYTQQRKTEAKAEAKRYAAAMKKEHERLDRAAHNKAFYDTMGDLYKYGKQAVSVIGSLKNGGKVKKTGLYKLHKNEVVMTPKQMKMYEKKKKKPAKRRRKK